MENVNIVIFGATGDLTKKKLMPALFEIYKANPEMKITGFARRDIPEESFRESFSGISDEDTSEFLPIIHYHRGEFQNLEDYKTLREGLDSDNILFYLAVDPGSFETIIQNIQESGLNTPNSRIIVEKPFGNDKQSAHALYKNIHNVFHENQIYIIDHYLGKETVQNILAFRFANGMFEYVWNKNFIDSIQITLAEDIGTEGRGGYYDKAGAIKDMLQSHILQILAAVTMDSPKSFDPTAIHEERSKVLSSLKHSQIQPEEIVFGQYEGYREDEKVAKDSNTDTFVAVKTYINNERWENVPIYIRTGKKLEQRITEVYIRFKKPLQSLFQENGANHHSNTLAFRLQPNEGISFKISLKEPGKAMKLRDVSMDFCYEDSFKISDNSYIRLLDDAVNNDKSLFTSIDEIIASWDFIEPIIAFKNEHPELLKIYKPMAWGPEEAEQLIRKDDREWLSLYPYKCDIKLKV